ncbi:MAG TPA: hypothetical protein VGL99_20345 [Chloroflexota bacterium]
MDEAPGSKRSARGSSDRPAVPGPPGDAADASAGRAAAADASERGAAAANASGRGAAAADASGRGVAAADASASGDSPYLKLPWPLVAGGLAAVLLIALTAGLLANRYLRPSTTPFVPPTSTIAAAAAAGTLTPRPVATPTTELTPAPLILPLATSTSPAASPTVAPVAAVSPSLSAVPTVDPALAAEVGRAYEAYWRVRAQAVLQLDSTHLSEVMDGEHLANIEQRISVLRSEGRAIRTKVSLNYNVIDASETTATIVDRIEDTSFFVKAGTEQPLTQPSADILLVMYRLQKISGLWKVVDSVRAP